jgi:hypothetical protein
MWLVASNYRQLTVVPDTFLLAVSSQAKVLHIEPITDAYKVTTDVPEVVRLHPWLQSPTLAIGPLDIIIAMQ